MGRNRLSPHTGRPTCNSSKAVLRCAACRNRLSPHTGRPTRGANSGSGRARRGRNRLSPHTGRTTIVNKTRRKQIAQSRNRLSPHTGRPTGQGEEGIDVLIFTRSQSALAAYRTSNKIAEELKTFPGRLPRRNRLSPHTGRPTFGGGLCGRLSDGVPACRNRLSPHTGRPTRSQVQRCRSVTGCLSQSALAAYRTSNSFVKRVSSD